MEGNHPLQLDKTCKVVERLENRQYLEKYDPELWVARRGAKKCILTI